MSSTRPRRGLRLLAIAVVFLACLGFIADRVAESLAEETAAIDLFLGAFSVDPPLIHAGGPFSDRAGAREDDMADFVPLDPLAELGWRIRLEGSQGRPEREFAGPVTGLQEVYRRGLVHLDAIAPGGVPFARLLPAAQDHVLADSADQPLQDFLNQARPFHEHEGRIAVIPNF